MSGNELPSAGTAAKSPPPAAPASAPTGGDAVGIIGKVLMVGWVVATGFLGEDINVPVTVSRGISEILSGSTRTGAGWSIILGLCLGACWFLAALIEHFTAKSPQPAVKPHNPDHGAPAAPNVRAKIDPPMPAAATLSQRPAEQAVIDVLKKIVADYQPEVASNHSQCERLIRERCADAARRSGLETRREAAALVAALQEDLPQRLRSQAEADISPTAIRNYATDLSRATGLDDQAAQFAVEAWATALGRRKA